jgi:mxaK protein
MSFNGRQAHGVVPASSAPIAAPAGPVGSFAHAPGSIKAAILWLLLGTSGIVLVGAGALLVWKQHTNSLIRELRAGKNVAVDAVSAPAALLEARASFLLTRDRIDEAQPLLDQASLRASGAQQERMLYNMANTRMRASIKAIEQGNFDRATPLVALAKSEYRSALRLDPGNWDAKFNLDVAMRLVRDLPRAEGEDETGKDEPPAKLWTDLPGVPKGLP